jgi:ABC-type amino acid transport substrate-binding protein
LLVLLTALTAQGTERPKYIASGDRDYPPYNFLENGKPTGFSIELMQAVAEVMDLDVEIKLGPWNEARSDLEQHKIDLIIGMFYSEQRSKQVDFSVPYAMISPGLFVRNDSPIRSFNDLRNKEVIVQDNDIMHDLLRRDVIASQIITVTDTPDALRVLASGKHDAALLPTTMHGHYTAKKYGLTNLREVKTDLASLQYCFAVSKGNQELLHKIDEGVSILKATGKYREVYDKWFGVYDKNAWWNTIRYFVWALTVVALLFIVSLLWTRSLRKQVIIRTSDLFESEQKLKAVVSGSPIPQFVIDRNHTVIYWNNALRDLCGTGAEEMVGTKQPWKAFYSEQRPCIVDLLVDGLVETIPEWYRGEYAKSRLVADAYEAVEYYPSMGKGGKWLEITAAAIPRAARS